LIGEVIAHVTAAAGRAFARQGREGRFDIMQKARMFVKVGWEERRRDGFMQNVEMKWVTPNLS
jgi:hypothetical protein